MENEQVCTMLEDISNSLDKMCTTLDKLTLDNLTLIQETIKMNVYIENSMSEGELHLAKARYILGHNQVSALQLPTKNSTETDPLVVVNCDSENGVFDLEYKSDTTNGNSNIVNPIKWFGVLVPQNLHQAQAKFRQSLVWIAKCASVQTQLLQNCRYIRYLQTYKKKVLKEKEEK